MLTLEELAIEYETTQGKFTHLTNRIMLLAADDLTVHSALIKTIRICINNHAAAPTVQEVANWYADALRELKAERAAAAALSLYQMDAQTFARTQRHMDVNIVSQLDNAMQVYASKIHAQAIITGFDPDDMPWIYYVDNDGIAHCMNDMGFACIGIGKDHANGQFASRGYSNGWLYYDAISLVYVAKKAAEIAPGVGPNEDMSQITKSGIYRIHAETRKSLDRLYKRHKRRVAKMERALVSELFKADQEAAAREAKEKGASASTSSESSSALGEQAQSAPDDSSEEQPS